MPPLSIQKMAPKRRVRGSSASDMAYFAQLLALEDKSVCPSCTRAGARVRCCKQMVIAMGAGGEEQPRLVCCWLGDVTLSPAELAARVREIQLT